MSSVERLLSRPFEPEVTRVIVPACNYRYYKVRGEVHCGARNVSALLCAHFLGTARYREIIMRSVLLSGGNYFIVAFMQFSRSWGDPQRT